LPQMAACWYSDIVKWFPIRSLPLTRMSMGYQNSNSVLQSVKLRIDREISARRVQRTQIKVTRALALPKDQHEREGH
jgi:hypothetical protein